MAISDLGTRDQYTATDEQTVFPYTFEIFDEDDVAVEQNGTLLSKTTHYTVSGVNTDTGGNITFVTGATTGDVITIYRNMALSRVTDYQQNGSFLSDEIDNDLDRLWAAMQQIFGNSSLGIRPDVSDAILNSSNTILGTPAARSGKVLGFDSTGLVSYYGSAIPSADYLQATTTAAMAAIASPTVGDIVTTAEYSTGNGGGGTYACVTVGTTVNVDLPNTFNIIVSTSDATKCWVLRPGSLIDFNLTLDIPANFPDIQSAVDYWASTSCTEGNKIIINIEAGHALTAGLRCGNGDYSHFSITSDDAIVYLDAGFVPATKGADDVANTSGYSTDMMFLAFKATLPELRCLIDMQLFVADGMNLGSSSNAFIATGCGVQNAGERGLVVWSNSSVAGRGSIWSGANDEGVRVQGSCSADLSSCVVDDCMLAPIVGEAAFYVSRASIVEMKNASVTGSGGDGLEVRRSIVNAFGADLSGASGDACLKVITLGMVDATDTICSDGVRGIWATAGARIYCGGATAENNSSVDLFVQTGGQIIGNVTTTNSLVDGYMVEADIGGDFTSFNQFSSGGTIISANQPDAIVKGSSGNHTWYKYSDGRMEYHVNGDIIATGTIAAAAYSGQLSKPTVSQTFIDVHSTQMEAVGRTTSIGGGSRVGVSTLGRTSTLTDDFKVHNSGIQTDSTGTSLSIASVQVQWSIFGTWK